jgi:peptide/nickel transport system permease protein
MLRLIGRRLAESVLLVVGAVTVVFIVLRAVPGDPATLMLGASATHAQLEVVREQMGLNLPLWQQYFVHLTEVFRGDFGQSWRLGGSALADTLQRLPATLALASYALILTIAIGFPLGIFCARRVGSFADRLVSSMSLVGQGLPTFWVGIMLILIFSRMLNLLPSTSTAGFESVIMPAFTLALPFIGWLARLVRNGVLEEMGKDYVRTSRAKGLSNTRVFYVHVLRNILVPVVTVLGLLMGDFIANAVIIEVVFTWPGIGSMMVDAITNRDYSIAEATILTMTVFYIVLNLLVDILYFKLDPRITPETV